MVASLALASLFSDQSSTEWKEVEKKAWEKDIGLSEDAVGRMLFFFVVKFPKVVGLVVSRAREKRAKILGGCLWWLWGCVWSARR